MAGIGAVVAGGRRGGGSLVRFREQAADPIVAVLGRGVELFEQVRHGHGRMPPLGPIVARIVAVSRSSCSRESRSRSRAMPSSRFASFSSSSGSRGRYESGFQRGSPASSSRARPRDASARASSASSWDRGCLPVVEPSFDGGDGLVEPVAGRELHGPPVTPPVGQFPQITAGVRGELA